MDSYVWHGRRLGYLGRYREAVAVFGEGLARHPGDPELLRHRGHRHLTLRQLERAVADLDAAARAVRGQPDRVEPDGAPNRYGIPRSTLHSNIWYHLGLAHYLRGDFEASLAAYLHDLEVAKNDDTRVSATYWAVLNAMRLDRHDQARALLEPIHADMEILENDGYRDLLLHFRGERSAEQLLEPLEEGGLAWSTTAYGLAAWRLLHGDEAGARALLERIVSGPFWPAFGHLAAEAELMRLDDR